MMFRKVLFFLAIFACMSVAVSFAIPLSDMGAEGLTIQSIIIDPVDIGSGQSPNFYLDAIKLKLWFI